MPILDYSTKKWSAWPAAPTTGTATAAAKPASTTELPNFFGRTPEASESGVMSPINLPKIPGFDPLIARNVSLIEGSGERSMSDLDRYRRALEASQPKVESFAGQEVADIGNVFSPGGYETQMANIRARRMSALEGLRGKLFGDLRRTLSLDRIGSGAPGLNSYLMEQAGDTASRIRAQEIADAAAQERADLQSLMEARAAQQGRRQIITDAAASRMYEPAEREMLTAGAWQDLLNRALQSALGNTSIGYATAA